MLHRVIKTLDGRPLFSAGFTDDRNGDVWAWVSETVAAEHEVSPDQVGMVEDTITVDGLPVYLLSLR